MLEVGEVRAASRELMDCQAAAMGLLKRVHERDRWILQGLLSMSVAHQQILTLLMEQS